MKKTIISLITILLSICLLAIVIAGCSNRPVDSGSVYTVTYRSNDETENPYAVEQHEAGETFTVCSANAFADEAAVFLAWYDGEQRIMAGETYTMPAGSVTFYAQWEGDVTAQIEGTWSGCVNVPEYVGEGNDLTVSVRKDEGCAYVVLSDVSFAGTDHYETRENRVLRLPAHEDGYYASEAGSIRLANNHLVMSLGEEGTIEFEDWCPLSASRELSGVWAADGGEGQFSIEFSDTAVLAADDDTVIGKVIGIGEYYLLMLFEGIGTATPLSLSREGEQYSMTLFTASPDGNALLVNNDNIVFVRQ